MSGSDSAPFLSQADDTDDGPVPGTPGLPGSTGNSKSEDPEVPDREGLQRITGLSPGHSALIVAVLCYINLLNYMDRFTVAGVLPDIEQFFDIGDSSSGLIQTVFISSYMVLAPVFGYLGDRYNRKYLMCGGIAFWSLVTLGSSFIPRERFWLLLLTRGLVGVGEASYSTIAPTLIADLFVADQRSRMLSVFYFAIPVGSGLGYIAGSKVKDVAGDWHWALRVTPGLGVVAVLLLFLVVREPPRGAVERHSDSPPLNPTSWWADLRALARNPSFILSSLGFTAVAFVTGSLALWAPAFLLRSRVVLGETPPCLPGDSCSSSDRSPTASAGAGPPPSCPSSEPCSSPSCSAPSSALWAGQPSWALLSSSRVTAGGPSCMCRVCCVRQGPPTTESWYPSEAAPPVSRCPVCSSEHLRGHRSPTRIPVPAGPGPTPEGARAQTLGLAPLLGVAWGHVPAPTHYTGSSRARGAGVREGPSSPPEQPPGAWCYL
uniref:Protein spinster homolog 1 n=1 Tax=Suricata suricatta TaxID=37032 RepID=A0A673VHA1_SURSU